MGEGEAAFTANPEGVFFFFFSFPFFRTKKKKNVGLFCFLPGFVC